MGNQELFSNLMKSFQDDTFQKAIAETLAATEGSAPPSQAAAAPQLDSAPAASSSAQSTTSKSETPDPSAKDFLQNTLKSFEDAMSNDPNFTKSLSSLMTSMLSNDLMC